MSKLWHYTKLILIPIIGNLYRLIYQSPANFIRFLYDFFRKSPKKYLYWWNLISKNKKQWSKCNLFHMGYEYDGFDNSETFQKWPTYTKTIVGIIFDYNKGNCMDFSHAFKYFIGGKLKIYIPDFRLKKIHYLVEYNSDTYELVRNGVRLHRCETARQVMEERYSNNTIYRIW